MGAVPGCVETASTGMEGLQSKSSSSCRFDWDFKGEGVIGVMAAVMAVEADIADGVVVVVAAFGNLQGVTAEQCKGPETPASAPRCFVR